MKCLNPCCSGQWSRTKVLIKNRRTYYECLNPCCSGQWSRTEQKTVKGNESSKS